MDVRLRSDLTGQDLAIGIFQRNGNISENCDGLQKNKLQNARDEMQETLIKIMSKIFSAKVVIERLPDIERHEKQTDNEQKNSELLEDNKENVLIECKVAEAQICPNCASLECSGCNHVDKSSTNTTELADKSVTSDHSENESNVTDAKKSDRQRFLQYYNKFCPDCSETQSSKKRIPNKCENCKLKWHYECKKCSKQLTTHGGIIRHLMANCILKGHSFACFKCNYTARHKNTVSLHLKKVHSIVNSSDRIKRLKSENLENDTTKPRVSCSKCERSFEKLPQLLRHLLRCGQTKYRVNSKKLINATLDKCFHHCVKCNRTVKKHKGVGFYGKECPKCDTMYSFKCKKCNEIFHSYNSVHLHLKIHHKANSDDAFKCPECDYKTYLIEYLSRHIRRRHNNETHACPNCGRKYTTRVACRDHARYCKRKVEFHCDLCSRKFKTKQHVTRHIFQVHTDGNEIDCPQCGITLKNKYSLSLHLTYCQKEAMFQCEKCPFKSKYKIDVSRHQINKHSEVQKNEDEKGLIL